MGFMRQIRKKCIGAKMGDSLFYRNAPEYHLVLSHVNEWRGLKLFSVVLLTLVLDGNFVWSPD